MLWPCCLHRTACIVGTDQALGCTCLQSLPLKQLLTVGTLPLPFQLPLATEP